ncbi:type II secretion system protein E [Peptococcaceae bacterium CEB3]|nr:type II secretion system protein E [Peptococcaceae bacterium CEB3]
MKDKSDRAGGESHWEFGRHLLARGLIGKEDLEAGLGVSREDGERIGEVLVRLGFLSREQLNEALSTYLRIPRIELAQTEIDPQAAQMIPEDLACRYRAIPLALENNVLRVAVADPTSVGILDNIRLLTGYDTVPVLADEADILAAIRRHLTVRQTVAQLETLQQVVAESPAEWPRQDSGEPGQDAPTVRLVDSILQQAAEMSASDIHWEPREQSLLIRFRLDGRLLPNSSLPSALARNVLSRLKMMAGMDVAERRLPQDGRLAIEVGRRRIDLRVSTLPTVYGEKAVVRILDPLTAQRTLGGLGMRPQVEQGLRSLLERPHGMVLITGPTGSGKTTTLYALVRELRAEAFNIVSIEDPVEYRLPGVNQVQVHSKVGLTFAGGLRAILRQDPDVIMVGEIRDEETAEIAVRAALTGHLVLSTLHTNTAAEAITRLLDMKIEPYLLADALGGVLSQRLVRVLCPVCKILQPTDDALSWHAFFPDCPPRTFRAVGCPECLGTGYKGRIGLHEFLRYDQVVRELILERKGSRAIEEAAIRAGMVTLLQDGMEKVKEGLTTVEEVFRVTFGGQDERCSSTGASGMSEYGPSGKGRDERRFPAGADEGCAREAGGCARKAGRERTEQI